MRGGEEADRNSPGGLQQALRFWLTDGQAALVVAPFLERAGVLTVPCGQATTLPSDQRPFAFPQRDCRPEILASLNSEMHLE